MERKYGILYVVATPMGNLKDITYRAVEVLKSVNLIAAEDTRHTKILTSHYAIETPLTSYFEYNKLQKGGLIIEKLKQGHDVALVSDAGTPGISDPGWNLINSAIKEGIGITVIPGPCALIAGLVVSGKTLDQFLFSGFLPVKNGPRKRKLEEIKSIGKTTVLYESPHRLLKTLVAIMDVFGDVEIVCAREITKKFEEILRQPVSLVIEHFNKNSPRGEFVLVL